MAKSTSTLGALAHTSDHQAVQVGSAFVTQDATSTPQTSPISYTTSLVTLVVPDNAIRVVLFPSTAMKISELSSMAQYDDLILGVKETVDCSRMQNIYLQAAGSGTLYFRFVTV